MPKPKKSKQISKPQFHNDNIVDTVDEPLTVNQANPDDEWPQVVNKSKSKKKQHLPTTTSPVPGTVSIAKEDDDSVIVPADEPVPGTPITTAANAEDEWPEDFKPRKGGKNKNKKNQPTPSFTVDPVQQDPDTPLEDTPLAANPDDEWPEDTRKPNNKKNKNKQKADQPTTTPDQPQPNPSPTTALDSAAKQEDDDMKRPLSKKEKEKLRIKRQKDLEKQKQLDASKLLQEESVVSEPNTIQTAGKKGKKGGKPGAPPIAALQKMIALQRAAEEEALRVAEEERLRAEKEQQELLEQEHAREQARQIKREKERVKKEQLRKEGKLLSKSQKHAQQRAALKLQQLIDAGMVAPRPLHTDANDQQSGPEKKRVVYGDKKKRNSNRLEGQSRESSSSSSNIGDFKLLKQLAKATDENTVSAVASSIDVVKDQAEQEELDDGVKSSWDMTSSDEDEEHDSNVHDDPNANTLISNSKESSSDDSDSSSGSSDGSSDDSDDEETEQDRRRREAEAVKRKEVVTKRKGRMDAALAARNKDNLRSPICCILGHVDTGKTKLLDKIRQTNVQEGEAGGITQQIGATYFPLDAIEKKIAVLNKQDLVKVPGLLVIDTPGHESFTNLRSRGSSLCNIAILVVDIMHGLEPQTIESLNLLKLRKTPFIVALNKIDRIYGWKASANDGFERTFKEQPDFVKKEFEDRLERTKLAFSEQGLNSEVYYKNQNMAKYVSLVPTSAITGEGIPDLLYLLCHLTQTRMSEKLMFVGELEATVLEVKVVEGLGTTIDVILSNGVLHENNRIVVCGLDGPIVTNVRALLTPQPLRELRVKSQYVHHKSIKAAMGIKISAHGLEKAVAGSRLLVMTETDTSSEQYELEESILKDEVMQDIANMQANIDKSGKGVWVQASTLGSLEALLSFLKDSKIPVSGINIGPVHRKDVMKASVMLDRAKEYAVMMCFDVKIDKDAVELAEEVGVRVFSADIIYHLFDQFTAYTNDLAEMRRAESAVVAVFPCILSIIPGCVFNKRDPIVLGVDVKEGVLKLGTPICVYAPPDTTPTGGGEPAVPTIVKLGKVTSIEMNHKPIESARKNQYGGGVAIKIECANYETPKMVGRHFLENEDLMAMVSRESIDVLKLNFRADMTKDDWALVIKLKKRLNIL